VAIATSSTTVKAISLTVNGEPHTGLAEPRTLLSDFIRDSLGLTGTNVGCEHGVCGACTIRLDGELTRSCLLFAVQAEGAEIRTVEGMAQSDELHLIQRAFHERHGLQCGFCTPAMLLTTEVLLERIPNPSGEEIREFLSGNVCRCTGYDGIVASIERAAELMNSSSDDREV
jgi:aerobic carbon-monoxide dehydrogenase small subunit